MFPELISCKLGFGKVEFMLDPKNCTIKIGDADMDYISFGTGKKNFVMLPGLGDALRTVKGSAFTLAMMYRIFAKDFKVFVFSRKNQLPAEYTIREMADDQAQVMKMIGISKAFVMGISQGGMIAMHLAADHPNLVEKLVLANTVAGNNDTMTRVVGNWIQLARLGDFKAIFADTAENTYSEKKLKIYRPMYPLLAAISKPKYLERFITQANACLAHNAYPELKRITCPTLVIGGDSDKIVGPNAASDLAGRIADSKLIVYKGLGHGAFEEATDFHLQVLNFLKE